MYLLIKNYKNGDFMYKFFIIFFLLSNILLAQNPLLDSLNTIRAFQLVDANNASSGYVTDEQFKYIKEFGFEHVISLLPGNQSHEDSVVTSLGMTFTQIEVNWKEPTVTNVQNYFSDMKKFSGKKVFLHCMANMRASAFMFLYRTTQLGIDKSSAAELMYDIWHPKDNEQWNTLIRTVLETNGLGSEY
jgi:protein tyrosine phosphatase (PTP) superfamily phosphohydrolase (DUF442 family)